MVLAKPSHPPSIISLMDSTEIIRQLQNDPALKAEMRAVLLTEELLAVPNIVATLAETMVQHNQRLEHLEATVNSLVDHQAAMQGSLTAMNESLQDLIQMTARGFATMEQGFRATDAKIEGLGARVEGLDARVEGLDAKFTAKFDQVDAKIDGLDAKITAKFDQVDSDIRDIKDN